MNKVHSIACFLAVFLCSCGEIVTDQSKAIHAAETMGWSDVKVNARRGVAPTLYGCSKQDVVAYDIQGKNPAGKSSSAVMSTKLMDKLEPNGGQIE